MLIVFRVLTQRKADTRAVFGHDPLTLHIIHTNDHTKRNNLALQPLELIDELNRR